MVSLYIALSVDFYPIALRFCLCSWQGLSASKTVHRKVFDNASSDGAPLSLKSPNGVFIIAKVVFAYVARWSSGLRLRPLTPATWVRIPYGSPF